MIIFYVPINMAYYANICVILCECLFMYIH